MIRSVQDASKMLCRIKLSGEDRWISVTLSLDESESNNRFVVSSPRIKDEMERVDDLTRTYSLSNWQGGIISGARYAFRALHVPPQQVCIHEMQERLSSDDIGTLSSATAIAVAKLLSQNAEFKLDLFGWKREAEVWKTESNE